MLKQLTSMQALSEDKFLAKAWSDYLADVNDTYANLMSAITEATTYDLGDGEVTIEQAISDICSTYGIASTASICLDGGYTNVHDMLYLIISKTEQYGDVTDEDSGSRLTEQSLQLESITGSLLSKYYSVADVFDDLKRTFHSSTVLQAAFDSLDGNSISDRLSVFKDKVQSKFTNVFDDISSSFQTFSHLIGTGFTNVTTFIGQVSDLIGAQKQAIDDSFTVDNTDMSEFTGASPLPALDFSCAMSAVTSTAKVVGQAVWSVMKGIGNVASRLFSWGSKKIADTFVPYDLEIINDDAIGETVDGWGYIVEDDVTIDIPISVDVTDMSTALEHWESKWIKYNCIFGEILIKPSSFSVRQGSVFNYIDYHRQLKFKPKPVKFDVVISIMNTHGINISLTSQDDRNTYYIDPISDTAYNVDAILASLANEIKNSDFRINIKNDDELYAYNCFLFSIQFLYWFIGCAIQCYEATDENTTVSTQGMWLYLMNTFSPTNADWVALVSGWDKDTVNPGFTLYTFYGNYNISNVSGIVNTACELLFMQQYQRYLYPLDYTFIPYQNNVADFDNSKFGIKTDSQNQAALTKFLTAAVIIVVVLVTAIAAGVVIRKISRAKFWKRQEFISRSDSAMWEGRSLSAKDRRKYIRYSRKLNASTILTGGLQESATTAASSIFSSANSASLGANNISPDNNISGFTSIRSLIKID